MATCRDCRGAIRFVTTEYGNPMPIDPEPREEGNVVLRGLAGADELKLAHVLRDDEEPFDGELRFQHHSASCKGKFAKRRRR